MSNFLPKSFERGAAIVTLSALGTVGVAGCGDRQTQPDRPAASTSSAPAPTIEKTPTLPAPVVETKPALTPEEILKQRDSDGCPTSDAIRLMKDRYPTAATTMYNALKEQSPEAFAEQPASVQVDYYLKAAFDQMAKMRYVEFFKDKSIEGKRLDAYNPFCLPLQKEANPYRIMMQNVFAQGLANATSIEPDSSAAGVASTPLDKLEAKKLQVGSAYPHTSLYMTGFNSVDEETKTTKMDPMVASGNRVLSEKDVTAALPNGKEVSGKELIINTSDKTRRDVYVFIPSETLSRVTGEPDSGLWLYLKGNAVEVTVK